MEIKFENILNADIQLIERIRNWRNSTGIKQYMVNNHYITKAQHHKWFENLKTKKNGKVWIIKCDEKPLGIVYLSNIDYKRKSTEWGFYIAEKSVRGKGIGSGVLYHLIEYLFNILNLEIMRTSVLESNPIALKMYEKFGFKKIKVKDKIQRDKKTINIFLMELHKEDWKSIRIRFKETIKIESKGLNS